MEDLKNFGSLVPMLYVKELKYLNCQVPIIVFASGRAIQKYGDEALRLGAYDVTNEIGKIISLISNILRL